jgi:hypothetical protein
MQKIQPSACIRVCWMRIGSPPSPPWRFKQRPWGCWPSSTALSWHGPRIKFAWATSRDVEQRTLSSRTQVPSGMIASTSRLDGNSLSLSALPLRPESTMLDTSP